MRSINVSIILGDSPLPGLNDYTGACRANPHAGAAMKRKAENRIKNAMHVFYHDDDPDEPGSDQYDVTFTWAEKSRRRDPDNIAFAKKFILDVLVAEGIIPNDRASTIASFTDRFTYSKEQGYGVTVRLATIF